MRLFHELIENKPLWIAIASWAVAQIIKLVIDIVRYKKIDLALFISSGGMPSSHSSFVTALATSLGMEHGFNSPLFAMAMVLSLVVMYDAAGVRRAAGQHAAVINILIENIENSGVEIDKKLKELLGHTPVEVFSGAILGVLIGALLMSLRGL